MKSTTLRWLLLALPFALAAAGMQLIVPGLGDSIADALRKIPHPPPAAPSADAWDVVDASADELPTWSLPDTAANGDAGTRPRATEDAGESGKHGLFVPARKTAELAARAAKLVHGNDATDGEGRPVGVRLSGIGGLGVGLADGDIVASIGGRPTLSVGDATSAIAAAAIPPPDGRAHRVSAVVLRETGSGDERRVEKIYVTVEVPAVRP